MAASKSGFGNSSEPANRLASLSAPSCSLSWKVRCPHSWPRPNLNLSPETAGSKAIAGIPFTHADSPSTPGNPTTGTRQTPARSTRAVMFRIGRESSLSQDGAEFGGAIFSMSSRSETARWLISDIWRLRRHLYEFCEYLARQGATAPWPAYAPPPPWRPAPDAWAPTCREASAEGFGTQAPLDRH